jgi:hypothetical protein
LEFLEDHWATTDISCPRHLQIAQLSSIVTRNLEFFAPSFVERFASTIASILRAVAARSSDKMDIHQLELFLAPAGVSQNDAGGGENPPLARRREPECGRLQTVHRPVKL